MTIIYETQNNRPVGAVIEVFKVFSGQGEIFNLIESIPLRNILLAVSEKRESRHFLLLDSGPEYCEYNEDAFLDCADTLISKINSFSTMIKEVGKAYDLELKELEECSEEEKSKFFSLPLVGLIVNPPVHGASPGHPTELASEQAKPAGEIIMGITRKGVLVKEPLELFRRTLVSGGLKRDRLHVLHVLIESALIARRPVIVLDWHNVFSGLMYPNINKRSLEHYSVPLEAVGFPIVKYAVGENVKIDLRHLHAELLIEMFGMGKVHSAKIIAETLNQAEFENIEAVVQRIKAMPTNEEYTGYRKSRAVRMLRLVDHIYPETFGAEHDLKRFSKIWANNVGIAHIISFEGKDERIKRLAVSALASCLKRAYEKEGKGKQMHLMLVMPSAEFIVPREATSEAYKLLAEVLKDLDTCGIGLVLECEHIAKLSKDVLESMHATITVIQGNDVGVQVEGRNSYRVLVRPGLSECRELKEIKE
jgi:hypothetical protein